jgi:hypothetical protein
MVILLSIPIDKLPLPSSITSSGFGWSLPPTRHFRVFDQITTEGDLVGIILV